MTHNKLTVRYHDKTVGTLVYSDHRTSFQYAQTWIENGFSISPLSLPLNNSIFTPEIDPFGGIFGIFNDSLPDGWGRLLIDRMLIKNNIDPHSITMLDRLAIAGTSGMGALEYYPEEHFTFKHDIDLNLDKISQQCKLVLQDKPSDNLDYLFRNGGSSGGARPKIFKKIDNEEWIIKFPSSQDSLNIGLQEYEYSKCAQKCGINVPNVRLFDSANCAGYFGIQRFDRIKTTKVHMASASALLETSHRLPNLDYIQLLKLTKFLCKSEAELKKLFALMCFNVFAHNRDDHSKNFTFLYIADAENKQKGWHLSPAYDLTYSNSIQGEQATTIAGEGKNPTLENILTVAKTIGLSASYAKTTAQNIQEIVMADLAKYLQ
ncbi:MAG: toxin HipA [Treponema sp. CETP13]|nr:MAG: toxin HipA [Treponema sp. CETP13]